MFGKKKEVKSYEYKVKYCIIGLLNEPQVLKVSTGREPLKAKRWNEESDLTLGNKFAVTKNNKDLAKVVKRIFVHYAYMNASEFMKRLVIISVEEVM